MSPQAVQESLNEVFARAIRKDVLIVGPVSLPDHACPSVGERKRRGHACNNNLLIIDVSC